MRSSPLRLAFLLLGLAAPAAAQGTRIVVQDTSTRAVDSTVPKAVPLASVPAQAQATEARLQEIEQILRNNRSYNQAAAAFAAAQDTIAALMRLQSRPRPEPPTKRSLIDLHTEWTRRLAQVAGWRKIVDQRAATLAGAQQEVLDRDSSWRLTRATLMGADVPPSLPGLVDQVLREIGATSGAVAVQVDSVVGLQSEIARSLLNIQQSDEAVADLLAAERKNLLRIDGPPIWRSLPDTIPDLRAALTRGVTRTQRSIGYFLEVSRTAVYLHLISTLGILLAVFWFRGKLEPHTTEQPAASARRLLDHPAAGALLITVLATLFLYPRAPLTIYDLALLLTVPPLLRLLPTILAPEFVRPAVVGSIVFGLQRLSMLLLGDSAFQRQEYLLIALAGAAGLLWLLRPRGEFALLGPGLYSTSLRIAARLSAASFAVAFVTNVVGNVSLTQLLINGTLTSAYLLLVLLTAVRLADGVLIVVTRSSAAGVSRFVSQRKDLLVRSGVRIMHFLALLLWLATALWLFDLLDPLAGLVRDLLGASFALGHVTLSLGAVLLFIGTVYVSVLIGRGVAGVLETDVLSRLDMPRGIPTVIGRLTRYTLISLGFLVALAATGVELTQLTILGGALGVGIGFGLQNIVNNFVSGLILAFERPIHEGDIIQLDNYTGEVRRIGFRASVIRTFDGAEVIVPNGSLISREVVNWTLSDPQRRLTVAVGVAYGTDPERVRTLLLEVVRKHPSVLKAPEPLALFIGFGDSALNFEVRFWTVDADRIAIIRSEVTGALNNALVAAGIEIPFPQRDVHLRTADAPPAEQLPGAVPSGKEPA